ncbi:Aldehyde/histidinol dehydrogenase [Sparassis latifolia]
MVQDNATALEDALYADLRKPRLESSQAEIGAVLGAVLNTVENLDEWTQPEKPKVAAWRSSWDTTVYKVPKGVVLIIGPWNYPLILTIGPLVGAIAAGCAAVVKAPELVPSVAALLAELFPKYLDPEGYQVVNGAIPETTHVLDLRWDHILFTGSEKTGRIVSYAAAKYVTPITLELGGKSPVVIDPDFDMELAAKRVLYGKLQNSGQLCVSPDYTLVPRAKVDEFIAGLLKAYREFWPNGPFHEGSQWGKIINPAHHARLRNLLEHTKGTIVIGGEYDGEERISPTVITGVEMDDVLMEDEIFGPILPIITVEDLDDAIRILDSQNIPLALYAFTNSEQIKQKLLHSTNSGTLVLNDTYSQLAVYEMPFGGQGNSGHGRWYGKHAFETFTHLRSYINVPPSEEHLMNLRYPPYTEDKYLAMSAPVRLAIPDA